MKHTGRVLAIAWVIYCHPGVAWGVFGIGDVVVDPTNLVQNTISAIEAVQQTANSAQQVVNTYEQIKNQVEQITNDVKNLQRFDLNYVSTLFGIGSDIVGVLNATGGVGFSMQASLQNFDQLYGQVSLSLDPNALLHQRQEWLHSRMEAARTAVQVNAIGDSLQTMYKKVCDLLGGAVSAVGNLDVNQVQAQQQGITQGLLLQLQQMYAGSQQLQAQREAEQAALEYATLQAIQAATVPAPRYSGDRGRLIRYTW